MPVLTLSDMRSFYSVPLIILTLKVRMMREVFNGCITYGTTFLVKSGLFSDTVDIIHIGMSDLFVLSVQQF